MKDRFDYCPDVNGTWAVIDLATGQPAFFGGHPVMMVDLERAEAITFLLNRAISDDPAALGGSGRQDGEAIGGPKRLGGPERRLIGPD